MTVEELKQTLIQVKDILQKNQTSIAPIIDKVSGKLTPILNDVDLPATLTVILGLEDEDAKKMVQAIKDVIEIESNLVNTPLTDRIVGGIDKLLNRPLILKSIALLL